MHIYELGAHGHTALAKDSHLSISSSESDENSFATASESRPNSGLGVASSGSRNIRPMTSCQVTPATALSSNRPGAILRRTDVRVQSEQLRQPRSDALARAQSPSLPPWVSGGRRRVSGDEDEAWDELAAFLRTVTPPPSNFMSVPTEPYSPTTASTGSSIRRKGTMKKKGALKRCLSFLRGASRQRKVLPRPSARPASPSLARSPVRKPKKRPPRIKLPDSAISGRTVDGHRHIAISIPIEHAHLGPEPRLRFPRTERRTRSMPMVEMSPPFYSDVNVRPMTAFSNEPHMGTQLGPVAEERESLSSRSWERLSQGGLDEARKVRLASRHTFGTVQEELSRPNTSSISPPRTPRPISDETWAPPKSPHDSNEVRDFMHKQALAALQRPKTAPRPISGQSGYSFRSFSSASPAPKGPYPMLKSSLLGQVPDKRRARAHSDTEQRCPNERSRDSSRDQYTLQESIFSEKSFLESYGTVASGSEVELAVIKEARQARRFSGTAEIVDTTPRTSLDAGESSGREVPRANGKKKRSSGHESKRSNGQASNRSSSTIEEEGPYEETREPKATILLNPEIKKVDKSITRQPQLQRSVEVVFDTPTDAASSQELPQSNNEEVKERMEVSPGEAVEQGKVGKGKERTLQEFPVIEIPRQKKGLEGKGKEKAASPACGAVEEEEQQQQKAEPQNEETAPSPVPSPKQRKEKRKTTILTRAQRIAELKMVLDRPGSEPKDLVWRRLSVSSDGSSNSTDNEAKDEPKDILVHVPVLSENKPHSLRTTTNRFGLTPVMTVADVKPSSPPMSSPVLGIMKKHSLPLSVSSPGTVATVVMTSPVPPFRSLGSVTPPDSPPLSRSSSSPVSSLETQRQSTALKHPSLKHLNSLRRRLSISGLQSPGASGRMSPPSQESTPRPKTAGKGLLASRKDFYGGWQGLEPQKQDRAEASNSVLKMSRSEIFERYEALRERHTRDMEKRLERLERTGDYWLTSMLPLLKDLSQTLGRLAMGKGNGLGQQAEAPEVRTKRRPETSHLDEGRSRRFGLDDEEAGTSIRRMQSPGDRSLDSDEEIMRHPYVPTDRSRANTGFSEQSRRLYLSDDHPELGRRGDDDFDLSGFAGERTAHRRPQTADGPQPYLRLPKALSGTTTVIDSSGARTDSMGTKHMAPAGTSRPPPVPRRLQEQVEEELERIRRMERLNDRIDAQMHAVSLGLGPGQPRQRARRSSSSSSSSSLYPHPNNHGGVRGLAKCESRSEISLATYAAPAADGGGNSRRQSGMHTVEPIMRELQFAGSRLSLESSGSGSVGLDGDSEVRRLREGPRAVIGFGAFGGVGYGF